MTPVETTFVDIWDIFVTRAMEEMPLIVRVTISLVHFTFLNLKDLPQRPVLDALNLEGWKK